MVKQRKIIKRWLEVCSFIVCGNKSSLLFELDNRSVLASSCKIEGSVVQTKLVVDLSFGDLTSLRVSDLKTKEILSSYNNILVDILSLDVPCLCLASCERGLFRNKIWVVSLNVSGKHVYVCNWRAKYFIGAEFDVKCVSLDFCELECYVVRAILVADGCEWAIVLICGLSGQSKSKNIVSGTTKVIELVACLDVYIYWLAGAVAL